MMENKKLQEIFIKILRSELNGTRLEQSVKDRLTPEVLAVLYRLSRQQDLAHMVSAAMYKNGLMAEKELAANFKKEEILSLYRYEQMKYAYNQSCEALNAARIPYVPLKGSVIRPYYPQESMRTSCDIDILVREEHLEAAIRALEQKGYQCGERHYHDVSLFSPTNIHLELHFCILENTEKLDAVLKDAWQYAVPAEGSRYEFTQEFFVFYLFAHISYHFPIQIP